MTATLLAVLALGCLFGAGVVAAYMITDRNSQDQEWRRAQIRYHRLTGYWRFPCSHNCGGTADWQDIRRGWRGWLSRAQEVRQVGPCDKCGAQPEPKKEEPK